ncbi:MAG: hypothetical protein ACRD4F_19195 [Candidatus Angelobacter sp.]
MRIDLQFDHNFEVQPSESLPGLAGELQVFYFPGASQKKGKDGVLLKVIPREGKAWLGCFAFGYKSPNAITLVTSCPDHNQICVVASGAGYMVRAQAPDEWESIPAFPIVDTKALVDHGMLVFADFTKLCAYEAAGLKWVSPRLSSDGVKIKEAKGQDIKLVVWDASREAQGEVRVDLLTGKPNLSQP